MFIYVIVCSETLKIYIGQHKGADLQTYLNQKWYRAHHEQRARSWLYNAMRVHRRESWSIHPLVVDIANRKELDYWEQLLIYALKAQHPDVGYNLCDGGEGRQGPLSEESKHRISLGLMGRPVSEETRAKIGAANAITAKGKHHSPEHNEKMRQIMKGRHTSTGMLGRTHSEETLAKMRVSAKGRNMDKAIQASANARRGKTHPNRATPEGIEKMKISKFLRTVAWG